MNKHCILPLAVLLALPIIALSQGPLAPGARPAPTFKTLEQIEPRAPISSLPFAIDQPGSYYVTRNLTAPAGLDGITINASDVTLDLGGFTLGQIAGGTAGAGIRVGSDQGQPPANLHISNGVLRGWGDEGLHALNARHSRFENLRAILNQADGIFVGSDNVVFGCSAAENLIDGIDGDLACLIKECTAMGNGDNGIECNSGTVIADCTAYQNGTNGFATTAGCTLSRCNSTDNDGFGFNIGNAGVATECVATLNGDGTNDPNNPDDTSGTGFFVSAAAVIKDCTSRLNDGFGMVASTDSFLSGNVCDQNGRSGIRTATSDLRIEGNHCTDNSEFGITATGAGGSLIIKNSASGNLMGDYNIDAGHRAGPIVSDPATATNPYANFDF